MSDIMDEITQLASEMSEFITRNNEFYASLEIINKFSIGLQNEKEDYLGQTGWSVINTLLAYGSALYSTIKPIRDIIKKPTILSIYISYTRIIRPKAITMEELDDFMTIRKQYDKAPPDEVASCRKRHGLKWADALASESFAISGFITSHERLDRYWSNEQRVANSRLGLKLRQSMEKICKLSDDQIESFHKNAFNENQRNHADINIAIKMIDDALDKIQNDAPVKINE